MTERELIEGCIREDRSCQNELWQRYSGRFKTLCRRYARHEMEAEDWLQDAFLKIFDNLKKFKHQGSFEGWMRTIVVNTCLKNCKKSSFQKETIGIDPGLDQSIAANAVSLLSEEELLKLIQDLPEGYRIIFNMHSIDGYSHKEIAEKLGIKESTSRSQLVKARNLLKQKVLALKKDYHEHESF